MEAAGLHFGHGTDNAGDEAAWLVLHVLGQPLDGSFDDWERAVEPRQAEAVADLLERRIDSRQPLAYLLGEAWFCGMAFEAGPGALVPRSPLAELIVRQFQPWVDPDRVGLALDLCTGGGCIAAAMARHLPDARVVACDVSAEALALAARNLERHALAGRVELVHSDLFDALGGRRFDMVVSNPPYVPADTVSRLPAEYRAEPEIGLVSGTDGLDLPLRILLNAANYLEQDGVLFCEVGESAGRLQDLLEDVPFTWLEFERGGEGVFTLDRAALVAAMPSIGRALDSRRD